MNRIYSHIVNVALVALILIGGYLLVFGTAALLIKAGWHA